jgi:hypothetical protein
MQKCSERAYAKCPYRHECGTIHEATFADNSDCAEFNRKVDSMPMTNADRIRAMSDEELVSCLNGITSAGCVCLARDCRPTCKQCIEEWLQEPAEVE